MCCGGCGGNTLTLSSPAVQPSSGSGPIYAGSPAAIPAAAVTLEVRRCPWWWLVVALLAGYTLGEDRRR